MIESIRKATNQYEAYKSILEQLSLPEVMVVTSGSAIKINTVEKALKLLFPNRTFKVVGVKAESGINEQPIGEQTEQGARNRIENAKRLFAQESPGVQAAFISIENGIFQIDNQWDDKAVSVIELPHGESFLSISEGVRFPAEIVEETQNKEGGFEKHTVGSVLAEKGLVADKQDPHSTLTNGAVTREQQMIGAIAEAFINAAKAQ